VQRLQQQEEKSAPFGVGRVPWTLKRGRGLGLKLCPVRQEIIRGFGPLAFDFISRAVLIIVLGQAVVLDKRLQLYDPDSGCKMVIHPTPFDKYAFRRHENLPPDLSLYNKVN
jgi:hypothetical protein